jgi:hypothetical protein
MTSYSMEATVILQGPVVVDDSVVAPAIRRPRWFVSSVSFAFGACSRPRRPGVPICKSKESRAVGPRAMAECLIARLARNH